MYVSLVPFCSRKRSFAALRSLAILVQSTRWMAETCGETRLVRTMCSAMLTRIALSGSTSNCPNRDSGTSGNAVAGSAEDTARSCRST